MVTPGHDERFGMLGSLMMRANDEGGIDPMMADLARRLSAEGVPLAGAFQCSSRTHDGLRADMRLTVLGSPPHDLVISHPRAAGASGCRLDPAALEDAAQRVIAALPRARLMLLSKFGRQEAAGRGFRTAVAEALGLGVPVLLAVSTDAGVAFSDFAGGLACTVTPERAEAWCREALARS